MDGPRHQLLAGAALAGDHDGRAAVRRLADRLEHVEDLRAAPDEVLEAPLASELLAEGRVLFLEAPALQRVGDVSLSSSSLKGLVM